MWKTTERSIILLAFILTFLMNFACGKDPKKVIWVLDYTNTTLPPLKRLRADENPFRARKCYYENCFVTNNPLHIEQEKDFDALLFDVQGIDTVHPVLNHSSTKQKFVFVALDSAANYPLPAKYNNVFNLTWTYKLDSDALLTHVIVKNKNGDIVGPKINTHWIPVENMRRAPPEVRAKLESKKIAAAWFVSDCDSHRNRLDYYKELDKELSKYGQRADLYGDCGMLKCLREDEKLDSCYRVIEEEYYFYLAFEDAASEDYVTDTIVTALAHYAIPIVYGGANYTRFMPKGIYLDSRQFEPAEMAKEMMRIILDTDVYYDFFKWHNYYSYYSTAENDYADEICALCGMLNEAVDGEYDDFVGWWNEPQHWYDAYNGNVITTKKYSTKKNVSIEDLMLYELYAI